MDEILVPIFLFFAIIAIVWLYSHYNFKKRSTAHETLRLAVEKRAASLARIGRADVSDE